MEPAPSDDGPRKKAASPAMEFVVAHLEKNPKAEYAEVKAAATEAGLSLYPIVYGRAQALLGLVKVAPRGSGKVAKAKAARAEKAARADIGRAANPAGAAGKPARTSPTGRTSPLDSLEAMIEDMKTVAVDRDRYLHALEQIADILDETLAD